MLPKEISVTGRRNKEFSPVSVGLGTFTLKLLSVIYRAGVFIFFLCSLVFGFLLCVQCKKNEQLIP